MQTPPDTLSRLTLARCYELAEIDHFEIDGRPDVVPTDPEARARTRPMP